MFSRTDFMFASFAALIPRCPRSFSVYENHVIQNNQIIYWVVSLVLVVSFDGLVSLFGFSHKSFQPLFKFTKSTKPLLTS